MQIVFRHGDGREELDLRLLRPDALVADLADALRRDGQLYADGRPLPPDEAITDVGLGSGAEVSPDRPPPATVRSGVRALVVGGIDAGRVIPLRDGSHVVGRGEGCDVLLRGPGVSRRHCALEVSGTAVSVTDLDSTVGTFVGGERVGGERVGGERAVGPDDLLEVGDNHLLVVAAPDADDRPRGLDPVRDMTAAGLIPFNRPPRRRRPQAGERIRLPEAPREQAKPPFNIVAILAPLLIAGATAGISGKPLFGLLALGTPLMALGNFYESRHRGKSSMRRDVREFAERMQRLRDDLAARAAAEATLRREGAPHLAEVVRRAELPSERLWERRAADDDFLLLSLGFSDVPWAPPIEEERRDPAPEVTEVLAGYASLHGVPVTVSLGARDALGIVGDRQAALAVARALVCQAAVHQGPADLSLALFTAPTAAAGWDWLKWLPHARDARGRTDERLVATGGRPEGEPAADTAEVLAAIGDRFGAAAEKSGNGELVLAVFDDLDLFAGRGAPGRTLLRDCQRLVSIVLAPTRDRLPAACNTVLDVHGAGGAATLSRSRVGDEVENFLAAGLGEATARHVAQRLARFEDPDLVVPGGSIPDSCPLLPLLGLVDAVRGGAGAGVIGERWSSHPPGSGLPVPIGVSADGTVELDIVRNGPHGLIGGTTGSGKSELLRSLVAGMAATAPPESLVLALVDFKGGETFQDFAGVPHVAGVATDLDEHLAERALRCLDAELTRREAQRNALGIRDVRDQLEQRSPAGVEPLPRLVVVIDEFGEMAGRLPDFLDSLDSIARRGRTLGVHLVLATQKPAGVVSSYIASNVDLKISLRVQSPEDSREVVGIPDAAEIHRSQPGRALFRFGGTQIVAVQTAYGGAPPPPPDAAAVDAAPFVLGRRCRVAVPRVAASGPSEIHRLLDLVTTAAAGRPRPRPVWPDPLPAHVAPEAAGETEVPQVTLGLLDDPEGQRQLALTWNLDAGNLLVYGNVASGKTTALLQVGAALALAAPPSAVQIYGLDFGAGGLQVLAPLPQTGGIVPAADVERQERLAGYLTGELARRRALSPEERAAEPRVVVLVDNFGGFVAAHGDAFGAGVPEQIARVFSDGPGLGVHMAITADRIGAVPAVFGSLTQQKVVLRLADGLDYGAVGISWRTLPSFCPGRGIAVESGLEVQICEPAVADLAAAVAKRWPDARRTARAVTALPRELALADLVAAAGAGQCGGQPWRIPLGIADATLEPAVMPVYDGEHVVVAGPARSGRSTVLATLARQLLAADGAPSVQAVALRPSPLRDLGIPVAATAEAAHEMLAGLAEGARSRPAVLLVDDADAGSDLDGDIAALLGAGARGLHLAIGGRSDTLRGMFGHWTQEVRKSHLGVLLRPDVDLDGSLLAAQLPRRQRLASRPGLGFLVVNGEAVLVQFATPAAAT